MPDALADELNAPRLGKADEALAKIGIDVAPWAHFREMRAEAA